MRQRKREDGDVAVPEQSTTLSIAVDPINEQILIAAVLADEATRKDLLRRITPEHFLTPLHVTTWAGMREMQRRNLSYDPAVLLQMAPAVDLGYLASLEEARPDAPENLEWHVDTLLWDKQRASAATGPLASLLEAIKDPRAEPERVRALARHVGGSFDGTGARDMLHDTDALVRAQIQDIRKRGTGHALYPYGIAGLDYYDGDRATPRLIPGAAPGEITLVTGTSGSGKSTFTCHLVLGLARQMRTVLYGAWEMQGGPTLELMACLSLGWSRSRLQVGKLDEDELQQFELAMRQIGARVRFMKNPFRRAVGEKRSNEKNLDLVQNLIADSGCDVFVADLWARCLVSRKPEEEEEALFRQQAMLDEMRVHGILVHQQRLKDLEGRADRRPTREGIKGSGAYIEVADTVFGIHRPALFKKLDDATLEAIVLKQRKGKWPLAVEFDWDPDFGSIDGGRTVDYDPQPGEGDAGEFQVNGGNFRKPSGDRSVSGGTKRKRV